MISAVLKAWDWLRTNALWLLLLFMGVAAGRRLLKRKDSEVATLKDALSVEQHKSAIEHLKGRREEALAALAETTQRDTKLEQDQAVIESLIAQHQRCLVLLHTKREDVHDLTDAEVAQRFRDAGL